MDKVKMHSPDLAQSNIDKLADLFPTVVTERVVEEGDERRVERAIDFDLLRQELSGHVIEGSRERYQLDWPGKREALFAANAPIAKTLRPLPDESVHFDTTKNLIIEGDNLDALKLLQESYLGKVKLIYIDPPYNTGGDFLYRDDYGVSVAEYLESSGQEDSERNRLVTNSESNGRFHSDWLSLMYPRLKLARNLLREDGLIIINIDEHEFVNISKLLSEVFGEKNDLGTIVWDKRNPKGDARGISSQHEYILLYARSKERLLERAPVKRPKANAQRMLDEAQAHFSRIGLDYDLGNANADYSRWVRKADGLTGGERAYSKIDDNGDVYRPVSMAWPNKKKAPDQYFVPLIHPVTGKPCPVPERGWRNPPETMSRLLEDGRILFGDDEATQPQRKYLLKENMYENIPSLLYYGGDDTKRLAALGIPFDTPKPVEVVAQHVGALTGEDDIVMDFFAGSGTTAHATLEANSHDGANRRFILVQVAESLQDDGESEFRDLAELARARVQRAADAIDLESSHDGWAGDRGFRAFRIGTSSREDLNRVPDVMNQDELTLYVDSFKRDRTELDLLVQVLLDWGIELDVRISREVVGDATILLVDEGALVACFEESVPASTVRWIAAQEPLRAVFRDSSFATDADRINAAQMFAEVSSETDLRVI